MSLQKILAIGKSNPDKGQKDSHKKEDITIRFARRVARPLVDLVEPYPFITPNRLTWLGFVIYLIGAVILVFAQDNVFLLFSTGFCIWLDSIIDVMDGELARKKGIASKRGRWLDDVLGEFKGFPFWLALGLNISNSNGQFTLQIWGYQMIGNTWFVMFILYGLLAFLALSSLRSIVIFNEPQNISFGHVYIVWIFLTLNLLELLLVLFTIGVILGTIYTLFEKTFLPQDEA